MTCVCMRVLLVRERPASARVLICVNVYVCVRACGNVCVCVCVYLCLCVCVRVGMCV